MQINQQALQRLRDAGFRGEAVAKIFEMMAEAAESVGSTPSEFVLGYQYDNDAVTTGEMTPVIILALRPVCSNNS